MTVGSECVECGEQQELLHDHHVDYEGDETVPVCPACHQRIHGTRDHRLQPDGQPDRTSIRVTHELADALHDRKNRGDSYEDVIWRLIEDDDPRPAADDAPADTADTDAAGARFPSRNPWGSTVEDALAWAADNEPFTRAEVLDEVGGQTDIKPDSLWKRHVRPALKEAGFESDRTGGRATWSRSEGDSDE